MITASPEKGDATMRKPRDYDAELKALQDKANALLNSARFCSSANWSSPLVPTRSILKRWLAHCSISQNLTGGQATDQFAGRRHIVLLTRTEDEADR
jgi:hypothetical protein